MHHDFPLTGKLERLKKLRTLREDSKRRALGAAVQKSEFAKSELNRAERYHEQSIAELSHLAKNHVRPLLGQVTDIKKILELELHTAMQREKITQANQIKEAAKQQSEKLQSLADQARKDYVAAHRATERLTALQKEVRKKEQRAVDLRLEEEFY